MFVVFFACLCKLLVTDLHLCWILKVLRYFTKSVMCLSGVDLFMKIQLCMNIPWLDYFSKLDETTEIGCNLYKSASHKNGWRAKLLNRTKNRKSTHMHERQPVGCYAISKARKACAVRVTIFSRGGKFRPVSNFSTHFYCTQVTCSYVLLSYSIAK